MDVTERFSDRVEDYVRGRPGYPRELLDLLELGPHSRIADLGSGTGLLSRLFRDAGHTVYGIEPNDSMRAQDPNPHTLKARAEATTLPDASVHAVVAGQAFHWFEPEATKRELRRILKGPRLVAWVWNDRNDESPLERDYLKLVQEFAPDYQHLRSDRSDDEFIERFMPMRKTVFPGHQDLDGPALKARILSSSCMPRHDPRLHARIEVLFQKHAQDGVVRLTHTTRLYQGKLGT